MTIRMFLWAILGFAVAGSAFWMISSTTTALPQPLSLLILAFVFGVSPVGTFWMLYVVIRHERRPLPYVLLAFIPYFSVGYYFERFRRNRLGMSL